MKQFHLNAKNCSGRGVRVEFLDPSQCESLLVANAKLLGPEGTMVDLQVAAQRDGVRLMIREVTVDAGLSELGGAKWKSVSLADKPEEYKSYFNAKDDKILTRLYREFHEVTEDEVAAISGKALEVVV